MNDIEVESPAPRALAKGRFSDRESNLRQRILVVDDDAPMRRLNAEVLVCYGYTVNTAEDGAEAWDMLQFNSYDLLLTDNGMPKMTGVQLLEKLHESGLELPTIMATGTDPAEEFAQSPWLQPAIVLLKPYSYDELVAAVKKVLQQSASVLGDIAPPPNWQSMAPANSPRGR